MIRLSFFSLFVVFFTSSISYAVTLSNNQCSVTLDSRYRLQQFSCAPIIMDFSVPTNSWELWYLSSGSTTPSLLSDGGTTSRVISSSSTYYKVEWTGLSGEVVVTTEYELIGNRFIYRANYTSGQNTTVTALTFPIIGSISQGGPYVQVIPNSGFGRKYDPPINQTLLYPGSNWFAQFFVLVGSQSSLYFAAEDNSGISKRLELVSDSSFKFTSFQEESSTGFERVLILGSSEWEWAVAEYRGFVFGPKGFNFTPLKSRSDISSDLMNSYTWRLAWGDGTAVSSMLQDEYTNYASSNPGIIWYQWYNTIQRSASQGPHWECGFPTVFNSPVSDFASTITDARNKNIPIFVYINALSADEYEVASNSSFVSSKITSLSGTDVIENFGCQDDSGPIDYFQMIPNGSTWVSFLDSITTSLITTGNPHGFYLDQASGFPAIGQLTEQYNIRIGSNWKAATVDAVNQVRDGKPAIVEHLVESYIPDIQGFLNIKPIYKETIPISSMLYSGYVISLGSGQAVEACDSSNNCDSDDAFAAKIAKAFIWGSRIGPKNPWLDSHSVKDTWLHDLGRFRVLGSYLLDYGTFIRETSLGLTPVSQTWYGKSSDLPATVNVEPVVGAFWKDTERNNVLVMVNWSTTNQTVNVSSVFGTHGLLKACVLGDSCSFLSSFDASSYSMNSKSAVFVTEFNSNIMGVSPSGVSF